MKHALIVTFSLVAAGTAHADRDAQADRLFQKGKKLQAEKRYADACPTFEDVDRLDPGIGAKLNVAKCYEEWGRLATAYRWYEAASKMADKADDKRAPQIKSLMEELDLNVPRIILKVREDADPDVLATLTMDGKPVTASALNAEVRVDPGPHAIEYIVDGKTKKKMAPVERGGESEITLDMPADDGVATSAMPVDRGEPGDKPEKPSRRAAKDPGRTRRIIAYSVAGAGVVMLGVAGVVTLSAKGDYDEAIQTHCMGSPSRCNDIGLRDTRDARSTANTATVVTLVGLAAIGGGIALYFTAPKASTSRRESPAPVDEDEAEEEAARRRSSERRALYIAPVVTPEGGGFALGGSF